jgi:hypothetical protein
VQDLGSDKTHPEAMSFNVKQYLLKSQPVADPGQHLSCREKKDDGLVKVNQFH